MNRRVLLAGVVPALGLLAVLFANLGRDPHAMASPLVGRSAPPFSLPPVGGGDAVSLEGLRGQPVVVNFWASWCGPCFEEHATLVEAARRLAGDVRFVGVVYEDSEPGAASFLLRQGSSYPSVVDAAGRTAIAYGVYGVPETFFIDAEGRIVAKHLGPVTGAVLAANLKRAGAPVRTAGGRP